MINIGIFVTQTRFEDGRSAIKIEFPHKKVLQNMVGWLVSLITGTVLFQCTQISAV